MNATSRSPAGRILVWDLPVRILHWLLVASFAGAWLSAESDAWRPVHVTLGYTVAALVAFRVVWGFAGTRHARFRGFVHGPAAVLAYLKSLVTRRPLHYVGHNPAGAIAIVALLALAVLVVATGYGTHAELAGEWLEEVHEFAAGTMLAVAGFHVLGVVLGSLLHHENLVRAMFTGRKHGTSAQEIRSARRGSALVLLALVAGVWWVQAQDGAFDLSVAQARHAEAGEERDDD